MTQIKICGIRYPEDAQAAVEAGANALGFNFWKGTRRYVSPEDAASIIASVPRNIWTVAVFVDESAERVLEIARQTGVSFVQLHGSETPEYLEQVSLFPIIKALKVGKDFQPEQLREYQSAAAFLLDGFVAGMHGGTGRTFDWSVAEQAAAYGKVLLAGGLKPANVGTALRQARPWGVDVCSWVETEPGKKDHRRIGEFIQAVRAAEAEINGTTLPAQSSFQSLL